MKLNKILNYFGIVGIALAFTGCTDDEPTYTPAPAVEIPAAYFSLENGGDIVFDETVTEYQVPVYRVDDNGSVTVPLTYSVTPETDGLTVPESVSFTEGEMETTITVSVDPAKIKPNTDYDLSLKLADGTNTPYALQTVTYPLIYEKWIIVTGIDKNGNEVDKALFCDDLVASMYGLDPVEYEVTIQRHPESENLIRVVDPYGEAWPYSMYGKYDSSKHHYMYFNISDPEMVYMCDKNGSPLGYKGSDIFYYTGRTLSSADGEIYISSYFNYYLSRSSQNFEKYPGKMLQGNITFGAKEMLASFANDSGLYYTNENGKFRIIMPGAEPYVDPMTIWNPIGTGLFTDGILFPLAVMEDENEELPTYNVEVMQFAGDPALYRIMNPWKAGVCPYGIDYSGDKYIELDTTNPDCVVMPQQSSGLAFSQGTLYIMNYATYLLANGKSAAEIIQLGVNDTFKDGVIYSKPGNLLWGFPVDGKLSLNQGEYPWQLVMPDASSEGAAQAVTAGKVFNGNGPLQLSASSQKKARAEWATEFPVFNEAKKSL